MRSYYLIDSAKGENIRDVAERLLALREVPGSRVWGFVFNDVIVRIFEETTADELVDKYHKLIGEQ